MHAEAEGHTLAERFERLVHGHTLLCQRATGCNLTLGSDLARFFGGYRAARQCADAKAHLQARRECEQFRRIVAGFGAARQLWSQNQISRADRFNLVEVLQLTGNEIRHSMVLAWLLSDRITGLGSHAQGNLGFRLFLEEVDLPLEYAAPGYWVRREVSGEESRVDIEIAARNRFVIHIESKVWAGVGALQTEREGRDLARRAAALSVPPTCAHGFFLTPTGASAADPLFRPLAWRRIAKVVGEFGELAQPPEVQLFARHYAAALRRFVIGLSLED